MKNCIVAQSGGPTAAINASLAGVIAACRDSGSYKNIYGAVHGIQGVLNKHFLDLSASDDTFIQKLIRTPAMYLGSCRFKLPDMQEDVQMYRRIFDIFREMEIGAFFYIGGNDSMDTVAKLSAYADIYGGDVRIIGIPKTIDNDLIVTDHTPGFGSAAKYISNTIREIAYDTYIYDLESVNIIEIMGRDAGWLTAASALARSASNPAPHLIYLPEIPFEKEQFLSDLRDAVWKYKNVIVAVSEGIRDKDGNYISATGAAADKFGHAQLSGAGKTLEYLVKDALSIKVRSVEINVSQRCAGHMTSKTDLSESYASGRHAVRLADEGLTGQMVTLDRISDHPYRCEPGHTPVSGVANAAKSVPLSWISTNGHDVTDEMLDYLKPLVLGEVNVDYTDGIVDYLNIPHLTEQQGHQSK